MNTDNTHPFGYWITAVDRLMKAEFATVFADERVTRREWRMLNVIDGTAFARVPSRPLRGPKMRRLIDLGWIERTADTSSPGGWTLTDAGRLAKTRLSAAVDELRARVAGAVTPDEYAALTASLEKIAREFGWEEGKRLPRRPEGRQRHGHDCEHGRRHAHGRHHAHEDHRDGGHRHGYETRDGHADRHGRGADAHPGYAHHDHPHHRGSHHGHPHRGHATEHHIHIHTR
ncbi:hypothetical protein [Microbacterium sp. H1-D42]|uniref:hypothetical protein n=1 Tax=Microbacterium sp. H1-D42 TaxID=2925844 RepID=UPI001F52DB19|nr:hypothetical protein [Microbacterium sp. H1-D42]UNK71038.1 hypothetical protein MNR00_00930 [Microbacterium sp. H1-D42]